MFFQSFFFKNQVLRIYRAGIFLNSFMGSGELFFLRNLRAPSTISLGGGRGVTQKNFRVSTQKELFSQDFGIFLGHGKNPQRGNRHFFFFEWGLISFCFVNFEVFSFKGGGRAPVSGIFFFFKPPKPKTISRKKRKGGGGPPPPPIFLIVFSLF